MGQVVLDDPRRLQAYMSSPALARTSLVSLKIADLTIKQDVMDTILKKIESVNGSLVIENVNGPESFNFAALKTVAGELHIKNNPSVRSMTMDSLEYLGSLSINRCENLEEIEMPALEEVDDNIYVYRLPEVATVSFEALHTIGGDFYLANSDELLSVIVPELETIYGNITLTSLQVQCFPMFDLFLDFFGF